jgi:hypothetical protein
MSKNQLKIILPLLLVIGSLWTLSAQKEIRGKSASKNISLRPNFQRSTPPNLFVDLNFKDPNNNGILEAGEDSELELTITNKGEGTAQGLKVIVKKNTKGTSLKISDQKGIAYLPSGQSEKVIIPISAELDIQTEEHKLEINVTEHFGYDVDPAFLLLNTLEFQKSQLVFSGLEIIDFGEGTSPINADGRLQAGELVKAKIIVQNIGQSIASDTRFQVFSTDSNIFLDDNVGSLGELKVGETKEFLVKLSPNKRVQNMDKLPVFLTLTEKYNKGNLLAFPLPLNLNQQPPKPNILEVEADIESIRKKVARFEYQSDKFTANIGRLIDIREVLPSKTKREQSVAVIFGVEFYENLPNAPFAENDARIVEKYFKDRLGIDQVVTFTSEETRGFIFDDVFNPDYGNLQKSILKGQTELFVFYSGHGLPSKEGEQVFLFPADGKVERLSRQGYDLNSFYTSLEKLGAKSVTVFLDACFSGASKASEEIETQNLVSMKGVRVRPKYRKPWEYNDNFSVFTSSTGDQTSLGFDNAQTGLFTYFLCAGLKGEADDDKNRKITNQELYEYLKRNVEETSKKIRGLQTPDFFGNKETVLLKY